MVNSMGGNGTPVAFNELHKALQTGVVDGAENNPTTNIEHKHYEVTKYYSLTQHLMVPEIFVFSKKIWDKMSPLDRQLIREASAACVIKERELWAAKDEKAYAELKKIGYSVNGNPDKKPFIQATEPRIDIPVDPQIIDGLCEKFADFRRSYEENGMTVDEFDDYGPNIRTLRQFIEGYQSLVLTIRELMLPNPDIQVNG
jgi:TRAP-type C4-dicarboxylate transport system substrate-binding protein